MDADLARLATLVAHEMRTPLSVVSGYMKMLAGERQGPLTEAQRRSVDGATRASQQLTTLAADLSLLAKIARAEVSSNRTTVAIGPLLDDIAAAHTPLDDHPVRVEADPSGAFASSDAGGVQKDAAGVGTQAGAGGVLAHADAGHLRRVLTVLLAAVVRGAPDEATLRIASRRRDAVVAIGIAPAAIIDELLAADPEALEALDESAGGLGVGLPLARALVALDQGSIRTRSTPQGLGILITLPGA
jgi:signal transduction histidine kinase